MRRWIPTMLLLATPALAALPGGWTGAFDPGSDGAIYAVAVHDGQLYVGGDFSTVGGVSAANVARWDGLAWHAMQGGTDGPVRALAVYQGQLVAGGEFTAAGPFDVDHVAAWTGSFWTSLGEGLDAPVRALALFDGLIATGSFTASDTTSVSRIARWNGNSWSALGSGLDNTGLALHVAGAELFVGGFFNAAGGVASTGIARWDGQGWSGLDGGVANTFPNPSSVETIGSFGGTVVAGGRFQSAGGVSASNVAAWDGTGWAALGDGVSGGAPPIAVFALVSYRAQLVAAGRFTQAGGAGAARIASWDGSAWSALESGLDADAYALAADANDLYVGGLFDSAGAAPVGRLARWNAPTVAAGSVPDGAANPGTPLTMRKLVVPAFAALEWGASCAAGDVDYAVYHGTLGDFASHTPLVCSTGGATGHSFALGADAYYLVVPQSLDFEGGYGVDAAGSSRPAGVDTCKAQQVQACR